MLSAACFTEQPATSVSIFAESDGCLKDAWKNQVLLGSQMNMRQSELCGEGVEECALQEFIPKPCLYGVQYDSRFCEKVRDAAADGNPYASTCLTAVQTPELCAEAAKRDDYGPYNCSDYCCGFDSIENLKQGKFHLPSNASCMLALGEQMPSLTGSKNTYNSMASLSLMPFKVTCQNLFARGVPHLISLNAMLVFLVCFFIASAITAGSAVPSGLLMPQMVLGALVGRCMALVAIKMQLSATPEAGDNINWLPALGAFFNAFTGSQPLTPDTDNYLDPGIAAVVGAAAFLGGSGRVTLFTTVMMVEITGDPIMIFPVNHGLYHALIDVQSSPYLPDTWQSDQLPPGICVEDMMPRNDPIVVPAHGGRAGISAAIDGNNYTGFPLVNEDGAVIGLCDRKGLEALMARHSEVTEDDLKYVSDLYPVTVRRPFPLQMAYQLFKSMDMKNLIVVDDNHKPVAVLT
ncbi:unnamed protein product [Polarella glacialis]|uniref:Chloride channel protein n=1 Tax=Polarella glacialis TaxID=89957 RepID=A0A813F786_POLGL|nr:unnamed protein product [Polarella glacialis]CAE8679945.1 unnamed protein product [Polarella glacialis]